LVIEKEKDSSETSLSIHLRTVHGVMHHTWNLHEHGCDNLKFRITFPRMCSALASLLCPYTVSITHWTHTQCRKRK